MTSLAVVPSSPLRPLLVAPVENQGRLWCIYSELKGWQHKSNERQLGYDYKFEDFGALDRDEHDALDNYYVIAQKAAEVVSSKLGSCGDEAYQKFKNYTILAAYDEQGNLQGVAAARKMNKPGYAAKVDFLVTAFWNMLFNEPKNDVRTRGAATCLLGRLTEIYPDGAIFVEPTAEAVRFYAKRHFNKIPNYQPKTWGAVCGMNLVKKDIALLMGKTEGQLVSCEESALLPTIKHYLDYVPPGVRKLAVDTKDQ